MPPQTKISNIRKISKLTPTVDTKEQWTSSICVLKYFTDYVVWFQNITYTNIYNYIFAYYDKCEFNNL